MWLAYKAANTVFEDESVLKIEFDNWINQNIQIMQRFAKTAIKGYLPIYANGTFTRVNLKATVDVGISKINDSIPKASVQK